MHERVGASPTEVTWVLVLSCAQRPSVPSSAAVLAAVAKPALAIDDVPEEARARKVARVHRKVEVAERGVSAEGVVWVVLRDGLENEVQVRRVEVLAGEADADVGRDCARSRRRGVSVGRSEGQAARGRERHSHIASMFSSHSLADHAPWGPPASACSAAALDEPSTDAAPSVLPLRHSRAIHALTIVGSLGMRTELQGRPAGGR